MTTVEVTGGVLTVTMRGLDQLWALRRTIRVPLTHVRGIRHDPQAARGVWHGFRVLGTQIPGAILAGAFYRRGVWRFFCVHDRRKAVVIELEHEQFNELVVEVAEPEETVALVRDRLGSGIAATPGADVYEEHAPM